MLNVNFSPHHLAINAQLALRWSARLNPRRMTTNNHHSTFLIYLSRTSVGCRVEDLVELLRCLRYWVVSYTSWNKLEHFIHLLNSCFQGSNDITADLSCFKAITSVMVDPFCIEMVVYEVLEHKYYEIIDNHAITSVIVQLSGQFLFQNPCACSLS